MTENTSSRSFKQEYELDLMFGKEPTWEEADNTDENFKTRVISALNWANGVLTHEQLKRQTIEYLISNDRPVGNLEFLDDWKFANVGKTAWLLNNGCPLQESWSERFDATINTLYQDTHTPEETDTSNIQLVKPTRMQVKAANNNKKIEEAISFVEDLVDNAVISGEEVNDSQVYHKFTGDKLDEKVAKHVYEQLTSKHHDLVKEVSSLESLTEEEKIQQFDDESAYESYFRNIEDNIQSLVSVINQVSSYLGNKKSLKKSERKLGSKMKAKRIEQQMQNLNFKVQDASYKVISINPTAIVGSQTLLAFNTKTRKLSIYVASTEEGLSVKGTTIQNYDEKLSIQKIIKDKDMLSQFQAGNIRRVEVLLDGIRAKYSEVTGRMNEHTVLLKVFREKFKDKK
jgi:hypothetical protein